MNVRWCKYLVQVTHLVKTFDTMGNFIRHPEEAKNAVRKITQRGSGRMSQEIEMLYSVQTWKMPQGAKLEFIVMLRMYLQTEG